MNAFKVAILSFFVFAANCFAQEALPELPDLQKQLVARWVLKVGDAPATLVVQIKDVKKEGGVLLFDSAYSQIAGPKGQVTETSVSKEDGKLKLLFVTQPGSKVSVAQVTDQLFEGTFTKANGETSKLTMTRVIQEVRSQEASIRFAKPGPDVPESCAALFGGWGGKWYKITASQRLWIVNISKECKAKISAISSDSAEMPNENSFISVEIKDGVLTFPCPDSGTCKLQRDGDKMAGTYTNPKNEYFKGVFEKIN